MTKRLFILFSLVICFNSWGITHEECETLKSNINSRLDSVDYDVSLMFLELDLFDYVINETFTAKFSTTDPTDSGTYQSTSSTYYYDSDFQPAGDFNDLGLAANSIRARCSYVTNNTAYIRGLLRSVSCDDSPSTNGCNCAEQLSLISSQVDDIFGVSSQIQSDLATFQSDFSTWFEAWRTQNEAITSMFDNVNVFLTLYTNSLLSAFLSDSGFTSLPNDSLSDVVNISRFNVLDRSLTSIINTANARRSGVANLKNLIQQYSQNVPTALANLNRWSNAHWLQLNQLTNSFVSVETNVSEVASRFSIFNDFVFSSDTPLSMYHDSYTDGSYHDYLTNYYIKLSRGQQSGSDIYTNWFSRIEILLASLVFQDDGTNFVDEVDNTTQMENTLSQSVDTLSQAVSLPEGVTGKIDNMGQSFLGLLEEWRTIVSGNSLPSQFVLCDINLGSQSRDSSVGSSVSSFRLETSLDSGHFRQFLDFCHAVTTILFTMLFVWLSIFLLSFSLASLAKLAKFCYMVYSALFGG